MILPRLITNASLKLMTRLLKTFSLLLILFCVAIITPKTVRAGQFLDAITSKDMNLQKFTIGEDSVNAQGSQGMLTILADGLTVMALGAKDANGNIISRGATGQLFAYTGMMYQQPIVSSKDYLADVLNNAGLVKNAYAAGKGYDFLKPVLDLWKAVRNVVYVFFIAIFVIIGFMIMFRSKLNPQTAVNIQMALPNIIVSLILVTFSFAICGFIVDLAYVGNGLIETVFRPVLVNNAWGIWSHDATPFNLIKAADVGDKLGTALAAIAEVMAGGGPAALFNVIIAITVVSTSFKIFFSLLTKYISLFLITMLSPFALLFAALPSGRDAAVNIFKQILSASLVFPATYFMINVAFYFSKYAQAVSADFKNIDPFLLTNFVSVANNRGVEIATIAGLISLGVLMATAQIPQVIDGALGVKPTLGAGTGEEVGGALRKIPIIGGMLS